MIYISAIHSFISLAFGIKSKTCVKLVNSKLLRFEN